MKNRQIEDESYHLDLNVDIKWLSAYPEGLAHAFIEYKFSNKVECRCNLRVDKAFQAKESNPVCKTCADKVKDYVNVLETIDLKESRHIGEIGNKLKLNLKVLNERITPYETEFVYSFTDYIMVDERGNIFVWRASDKAQGRNSLSRKKFIGLKAKVVKHLTQDDVKFTVISHCRPTKAEDCRKKINRDQTKRSLVSKLRRRESEIYCLNCFSELESLFKPCLSCGSPNFS